MQAPHTPTDGDRLDLNAANGSLLYITVKEVRRDLPTSMGTANAVLCDVAVLDGEHKGSTFEFDDVLLFPKVLFGQLSPAAGSDDPVVVGRLGKGQAKPGKSAPWVLDPPNAKDLEIAAKYEAFAAKAKAAQDDPF
jgi:hypothetical protein